MIPEHPKRRPGPGSLPSWRPTLTFTGVGRRTRGRIRRREIRAVPILASFLHELMALGKDPAKDSEIQRFVEALGETLASWPGRICLVGGVDLAHVGPRFGDSEPVTDAMLQEVAEDDYGHARPRDRGRRRRVLPVGGSGRGPAKNLWSLSHLYFAPGRRGTREPPSIRPVA